MGTGKAGTSKGDNWSQFELSEPGGLCADQTSGLVYVADTNNHRVVILDTVAQKCSVVSTCTDSPMHVLVLTAMSGTFIS